MPKDFSTPKHTDIAGAIAEANDNIAAQFEAARRGQVDPRVTAYNRERHAEGTARVAQEVARQQAQLEAARPRRSGR